MKKLMFITLLLLFASHCNKKPINSTSIPSLKDSIKLNSFVFKLDGYDYTQLGILVKNRNLDSLKILISNGANVDIAKSDGIYEFDALYIAIENDYLEIVEYLLNNGSNVNKIYTENGITPLSLACYKGNSKIVKLLIDRGANVNGAELLNVDYNSSPILLALRNNNIFIAEILLKNGASLNAIDENGNSANEIAIKKGSKWQKLFEKNAIDLPINNYKKWRGVYYYNPYKNKDSIGNYYVNIKDNSAEFGFSGKNSFQYQTILNSKGDTLFLNDNEKEKLFGKIYLKNRKFYFISDYIVDYINKGKNYELQYAKSADDVK